MTELESITIKWVLLAKYQDCMRRLNLMDNGPYVVLTLKTAADCWNAFKAFSGYEIYQTEF